MPAECPTFHGCPVQHEPHPSGYDRFMRLPEVLRLTSLSRSTLYEKIKRGLFPKQVALGENIVAWYESDVLAWLHNPT